VVEALRRVARAKLRCSLYTVSTVQEELGLRGARTSAYGVDPQIGVAVDVTLPPIVPRSRRKKRATSAWVGVRSSTAARI
jgi:endoglucanase